MTTNGKPPAARKPRKSRSEIKETILHTDPTRDYRSTKFNFWGELIQGLPPWRLLTGRVMLSTDPLVSFTLAIRNAALMPAEIIVECANPVVKAWIEDQWSFLWNQHRNKLVSAKKYGFAPLQVKFREKQGLVCISGLKDFAPEDCRALEQGSKLVGQRVQGEQVYFPQALWLTFKGEYGNPYGYGCLRRAYPAFYEKWMSHGAKELLKLRMIKDAYIGDVFWYPENMKIKYPDGTEASWRDMLREISENRLSGAALTLPRMYDQSGKELTGYDPPHDIAGGSQIFDWLEHCNEGIFQGAEISTEVVQASETGSGYSGRSIPLLVLLSVCTEELVEIVRAVDEQVLRILAWLNWGGDVDYQIYPRSLVESFSQDTSGSPMGGAAIGTQAGMQPQAMQMMVPQRQAGGVQFAERSSFKHSYDLDHIGNGQHIPDRFYDEAPVRNVDLSGLQNTDHKNLNSVQVSKYHAAVSNDEEVNPIYVIRYNNKDYIVDGRHRAEAHLGAGKETVKAHVLDYKKLPPKHHWVDWREPKDEQHSEGQFVEGGRSIRSWLSPYGQVHPVPEHTTHEAYAKRKLGQTEDELFAKGWHRIAHDGQHIYSDNTHKPPNQKQLQVLTDHALEHGFSSITHDNSNLATNGRVLWTSRDHADAGLHAHAYDFSEPAYHKEVKRISLKSISPDKQNLKEAAENIKRGYGSVDTGPVLLYRREGSRRFEMGDGHHRYLEAQDRGDTHIDAVFAKEVLPSKDTQHTEADDDDEPSQQHAEREGRDYLRHPVSLNAAGELQEHTAFTNIRKGVSVPTERLYEMQQRTLANAKIPKHVEGIYHANNILKDGDNYHDAVQQVRDFHRLVKAHGGVSFAHEHSGKHSFRIPQHKLEDFQAAAEDNGHLANSSKGFQFPWHHEVAHSGWASPQMAANAASKKQALTHALLKHGYKPESKEQVAQATDTNQYHHDGNVHYRNGVHVVTKYYRFGHKAWGGTAYTPEGWRHWNTDKNDDNYGTQEGKTDSSLAKHLDKVHRDTTKKINTHSTDFLQEHFPQFGELTDLGPEDDYDSDLEDTDTPLDDDDNLEIDDPTEVAQFAEEPHKFSSTQFNLPPELAEKIKKLQDLIPDVDLAEEGKEEVFHITCKYGLHTNDIEEVRKAVEHLGPVAVQLGPVSCFLATEACKPTEPGSHDVLKIEVISQGLHVLNKAISESCECTDTHPIYQPHITLAYVKAGKGEELAGILNDSPASLKGTVQALDTLVFSNKLREHTDIKLTGIAQFSHEETVPSTPFQFEESDALKALREFVQRGMQAKVQAKLRSFQRYKTLNVDTQTLAGLIQKEIEALHKPLAQDFATSMYSAALHGIAAGLEMVPESVAGKAGEPVVTESYVQNADLPVLDETLARILKSPVAAGIDYRQTAEFVQQGAFAITGDLTNKAVAQVRDTLAEVMRSDDKGQAAFIEKVTQDLGAGVLSESHIENVFRTNALSAMSNGQDRALAIPMVADAFPYRGYSATHDARTRKEHKALETLGLQGTNIYRSDDPTWKKFRPIWDYQCLLPGTTAEGIFWAGFKSRYDGEVVQITTETGNNLTVTINHPVFTLRGWVAAGELFDTDYVIENSSQVHLRGTADSTTLPPCLNEENRPPLCEEVFSSLQEISGLARMGITPVDFHGDAKMCDGYVEVVAANRKLLLDIVSEPTVEDSSNLALMATAPPSSLVTGLGELRPVHRGLLSTPIAIPSSTELPLNSPTTALLNVEPLCRLRFGLGAWANASLQKAMSNSTPRDGELHSQSVFGRTLQIETNDLFSLVQVKKLLRLHYSGPVYDLSEQSGWIVANNIGISNCRCGWYPVTVFQAAQRGVTEAQQWLQRAQDMATQRGGRYEQYLSATEPLMPEHVPPPPFNPSPQFARIEAQ